MKIPELKPEDMSEALDGLIPKETYNLALKLLTEAHSIFNTVGKISSRGDILKAVKLAFIGGQVPSINRDKILSMSGNLVSIMESIVVCKGYEMQNESAESIGEENNGKS